MPKSTVSNITPRIEVKPSRTDGIVNFDIDNAYPQRVIDIINSSGTGTLCSEMMRKFINGEGFVSDELGKLVINSNGLTANKLLFKISKSVADHHGFIVHINYDMNFRERNYSIIPFSYGRFTEADDKDNPNVLAIYDDWDKKTKKKIMKKEIDYLNFYNPDPEVIQSEVNAVGGWENYKGQALYWTTEGREYVLAPSDPVLEDIQTDSHAKIFKNRNITTNFMASHIIETSKFESDEEREEFIQNLTDFQGDDNALKLFLLEKEGTHEGPGFHLEKIDIQDVEKLYEFTEGSVRDNIIRRYQIPPILLLAIPGKLGSSSEIQEATALYNGTTSIYRNSISESIEKLFKNSIYLVGDDFKIKEIKPSIVDVKDTEAGKTKIVEILLDSSIDIGKKKILLTIVYGYSEEEAIELTRENLSVK